MKGSLRAARQRKKSKRRHLKYQGIQPQTRQRYSRQLLSFFDALCEGGGDWPRTWEALDLQVAEHINDMYQAGDAHGYAGDLLSGFSRWMPASRGRFPTARLWHKNWRRCLVRTQALPMPAQVLRGMAGVALVMGRPDLAALLPAGFLCMLRTQEIYCLRVGDVTFQLARGRAILRLRTTKRRQASRWKLS